MVVGIDEVGRGCWAGPLVAAAVILSRPIKGLRDSKKLSRRERERLDAVIRKRAVAIGLGWVTSVELDAVGMTQAVRLAMQRALSEIKQPFSQIIIDGSYNYLRDLHNTKTIVNADDTVPAVSAASIVAKVARDNYMTGITGDYPNYSFERHVGYGTALHRAAIELYGLCDLHRRSFAPIKAYLVAKMEVG